MASIPITSWPIEGEKVEAVTEWSLFLGSKTTLNDDCTHEIRRCLLFRRKAMTILASLLKSRHNFANKRPYSQSYDYSFLVVLYRCENWTTKKAEHQRTDAFELWCWIRFLKVPWAIKRSSQSILKQINPEYFLEGLMLQLCFNILAT